MREAARTSRLRRKTAAAAGGGPRGTRIHSVIKAVEVLKLLSQRQVVSVKRLSFETQIPKPSIMRIIGTLETCGLVKQLSRRAGYCLTSKVLGLSAGYHGLPAVIEIGAPFADALTRELLWPSAITTLDVDAMVVRYSTIPASPYAHVSSTMNKRLSLVERAHGRAYLAFCSRSERDSLLSTLEATSRTPSTNRSRLLRTLKAAHRAGYAKRALELDPKTSTIAAPILVDKKVRATIGLTFFTGAVDKKSEAVLARHLIDTATAIGNALRQATERLGD